MRMPEGIVDRATVLHVLRANKVAVSVQQGEMFLVVRGDISDIIPIPPDCARKLIHNLSRKFKIPIYQFYNPLMAPPLPGELIQ
jgi:hypothetical protein